MPLLPQLSTARRCMTLLLILVLASAGALTAPPPAEAAGPAGELGVPAYSSFKRLGTGEPVQVRTLSSRADMVSGGNTFVEVRVPRGTNLRQVRVVAAGRDVTKSFRAGGPGLRGLVTGLPRGRSAIKAALPDGRRARLVVRNASTGGPVFSGPLIQPWTCNNDSKAKDCRAKPTVQYHYKSTNPMRSGLQPYNPASPPSDVATTKTDEGKTVPFIVREETGYSLRDQYKIAALWDPKQGSAPNPAASNPGFANKLVLAHGFSCDTSYESGDAPDVLFEDALSQGFAVASHALDNAGHNCNLVTQAESLIMTKEMVVERFGPLNYTIGTGCSGGSLVQQQVANAYPGVYQGITPQCSFTDAWSSAQQYVDYVGLRDYLEDPSTFPEHKITPAQWPSIFGHANPANQVTFTTAIANSGEPTRNCPGVPRDQVYDEKTNPDGVRCTLHDYMRNVFGVDGKGRARRPISNVGIQYGLSGLLASIDPTLAGPSQPPLTPDQFVALNVNAGGYDIDFNRTKERTQADPIAQQRVYRSGAVNNAAHLNKVAIIDLGGPEPGAFHDVYRKHSMRARLIREHGTAANQVLWEGQTPLLGDPSFVDDSISKMDQWLAAVAADRRTISLAKKIIAAKAKAGVAERCVAANGADAPLSLCDATVDPTIFSSPRIEAGGGADAPVNGVGPAKVGFTDDRLDCQTMPITDFVYAGKKFSEVFSAEQQAALKGAFPTGVCDYSKPGKAFADATPWLTYQGARGGVIYGGKALGAPPVSTYSR